MKIEIEPQDIEAIAQRVFALIRPLIVSKRNEDTEGDLSNVKEISKYLGVKPSWVYGRVHNNTLPHIKVGKYLRFRKVDVDGWLKLNQTRTRY
jgi:excisionase family DNA binding protein